MFNHFPTLSIVGHGSKTVTTAGTPVQLDADTPCKRVFVQSHVDNGDLTNGGLIAIGGSNTVRAASASQTGYILRPSQSEWFYVDNLNLLWIDCSDNSGKVTFYYEDI